MNGASGASTVVASSRPPEPALVAAAGFVAGVLAAPTALPAHPGALAVAAAIAGGAACACRPASRRAGILRIAALLLLGAALALVRLERVAAHDLARRPGPRAAAVRLACVVLRDPEPVLAHRDRLRPADASTWRVPVRVTGAPAGIAPLVSGRLDVRSPFRPPVRAGERIEIAGRHVRPRSAPRNPGERARTAADAGWLFVEHPALVRRIAARGHDAFRAGVELVLAARRAADRALARHLDDPERAGLLGALVLGRADPAAEDALDAVRRVGLAHLFAISGLHLGIVGGLALLPRRWRGVPRRRDGAWLALALAAYLSVVEPRAPVLRAGVGLGLAALGMALGIAFRARGLLGVAALVLAAFDPRDVASPGFQLSFVVVLALVQFGTPPPDPYAWLGGARARRRRLRRILRPGAIAWIASLPLVAHHFGAIPLYAVPLGLLALPVVVALLVGGLVKIALAGAAHVGIPFAPALETGLAAILDGGAGAIATLARAAGTMPGASLPCAAPGAAWTTIALAWIALLLSPRPHVPRALAIAGSIALALPLLPPRPPPHLRLDTLDVADGSCHLLRRGGAAMLVDAGSARDGDAGRRVIVPALRALGLRHLDTIAITHADLDHYAGLAEVLDAWRPAEVVLPLGFAGTPAQPERGAVRVLDLLRARRVPVRYVRDGMRLPLGDAGIEVLHPRDVDATLAANDRALALRVADPAGAVLLVSDLEDAGIARLRARHPGLRADVLELPHHGAFGAESAALVEAVAPRVLVQSTGPRRLDPDAWAGRDGGRERLVTARDGAVRVELRADGVRTGTMRDGRTIRP